MTARLAPAVLAAALLLAGCGSSQAKGGPAPRSTHSITVLAAASLTEAFTDLRAVAAKTTPPVAPRYSFAGSQQLVAQIQAGAPADVVATADEASMQKLVAAGLVDRPVTFAGNTLVIAVRSGNPKHIAGLVDMARPDLAVVLADPSVPAGRYAADALRKAGVTVKPRSLELDVKAALRTVDSGEADAAIVYASDARADASVTAVIIPAPENVTAAYPVAVVRASHDPEAARAFISALTGEEGRRILAGHGFAVP